MRTSWKLINKELSQDHKNLGIQSVNINVFFININGGCTADQQIIADAFSKHFIPIPNMINQNINANCCLT
jgi:hypothetical protein